LSIPLLKLREFLELRYFLKLRDFLKLSRAVAARLAGPAR
jgi:hypothetical protein